MEDNDNKIRIANRPRKVPKKVFLQDFTLVPNYVILFLLFLKNLRRCDMLALPEVFQERVEKKLFEKFVTSNSRRQ